MYVQPSMTSTVAGVVAAISRPASTGPASCVSWLAPDRTALTLATACSSSPATSGTTSRDEAKYGAAKIPIANVVASSAANERCPVLCRIGMTSISGPRAASEMSIVFFAPSFAITVPAGMPKIAIGSISAARTQPIFGVESVVARTNHGSATKVIDVPVKDTSSAESSPMSERFLNTPNKIKRTYGFVKWLRYRHAEGDAGASRSAPRRDPRRRASRVRRARLRGRDRGPARGRDRALARGDLPLLREQERPVRRARDGDEHPLRRHPHRVGPRRGLPRADGRESRVAGRADRDREPDAPRRRFRAATRGEVGRRQPPHPGVVRATTGRGEAPRRRRLDRARAVHDRSPQRPRVARSERRPVRHRGDVAATRGCDRRAAEAAKGAASTARAEEGLGPPLPPRSAPPRHRGEIAAMLGGREGPSAEAAEAPRTSSSTCETWPKCSRRARPEFSNLAASPRGTTMFATSRRYEGIDQSKVEELTRKVNDGLIPRLSKLPGFQGYFLIEAGDGVVRSTSLFETSEQAEGSSRVAAEWTQEEKLQELIPNAPTVVTRKVLAHETKVPALV